MALSVGLGTISGQVPPGRARPVADVYADTLRLARVADDVGFDSLWFSEHHGAADSHLPSPIVMLSAAAAVTSRLALGSGIALGPFQHPLRFAEDCAVADQLSGGRLIVGLGVGWRQAEFDAFGIPLAERAGRTAELVRVLRLAWTGEPFSHHGRYFRYDGAVVTPKPFGRLPLFLGGSSAGAIARAGRLADGFLGGPQDDLATFRAQVAAFDAAARAAGRDPSRLAIGFQVYAWVSADGAIPPAVGEAMWHKMGTSLRWHAGAAVASAADLPPLDEAVIRRRAIAGTPAQVIASMRPWLEAFAGRELHILFRLQHAGLPLEEVEPAVRLFASEVIPALRQPGRLS